MVVFTEDETCRNNVIYNNTTQKFAWLRSFVPLLFVFASQRNAYPNDNRVVSNRLKTENTPTIKFDIA